MPQNPPSLFEPLPYRRPRARRPDSIRLDGNEGLRAAGAALAAVAALPPDVLRDYPECGALERQLADRLGVDARRVVVTAGADDALDRCCRSYLGRGRRMILPVPGFEMLHRFAATAGGSVVEVPWIGDFPVEEVISDLSPATTLIAMVSPNNPSGALATADDLERVAEAALEKALVLVDQVYFEYADPEAAAELTRTALRLDNVVLIRSFSKARGLAGCRVGYAVAAEPVADVLRSVGNPYPCSGLSLALASAQLEERGIRVEDHVKSVRNERVALRDHLADLGIQSPPSEGNFLLPDFGTRVGFVFEALRAQGVLVRWFRDRPGLETRLRITLPGDKTDFRRLLEALELSLAPQALLFDLDGVLADVSESYDLAILATARDLGCSLTASELGTARMEGDANNDWELTRRLVSRRGIDCSLPEVTRRFQEHYLGDGNGEGLRARERPLIPAERLAVWARRFPLAVVTGRPRDEAVWFLERTGMRPIVSTLVTMEDGPPKPDPAPALLALERLGVERAWMIGDTPDDVRSALDAGALPIGVHAPGNDPSLGEAALLDAGAATVLCRTTDLEDLLP
jgi:histidinol-phosphate aminotransferase